MVAGTVVPPSPVDADHLTPDETKEMDVWEDRETSDFIEASFRSPSTFWVTDKVSRVPGSCSRGGVALSKAGYGEP